MFLEELSSDQKAPGLTVQALFRRYRLQQSDLTRALSRATKPMTRVYAHYIWSGVQPPSINVILAIRRAYPYIAEKDLLQLMEDTRHSAEKSGDV
jgi:hypothetical protein